MWEPNLQVSSCGILIEGSEITGQLLFCDFTVIICVVLAEHAVVFRPIIVISPLILILFMFGLILKM